MSEGDGAGEAPFLSIITVTYGARDMVRECVASVAAHAPAVPYEMLLIDNAGDGTVAAVRAEHPWVVEVPSEGNIGFGAGNNRLASASRGKWILLLNPDTVVLDGAIDRLLAEATARPEIVAWGGQTVGEDGRPDSGSTIVIPWVRHFARMAAGDSKAFQEGGLPEGATEPGPVEVLCGGFMMVRADIWRVLGGFDEGFFLYSEEIDLFLRLQRMGHRAWMVPAARIRHHVGSGNSVSASRIHYKTLGQMHFAWKHYGTAGALATAGLIWLIAVQRWLASLILRYRKGPKQARWQVIGPAYGRITLMPWRWWRGYR